MFENVCDNTEFLQKYAYDCIDRMTTEYHAYMIPVILYILQQAYFIHTEPDQGFANCSFEGADACGYHSLSSNTLTEWHRIAREQQTIELRFFQGKADTSIFIIQ